MPLRSIATLPTLRDSRTRWPLAEMSMVSSTLAPLNTSVSVPSWPSTVSLPSPGFQTKVSLPAPSKATSLPWPPVTVSLPSPPISMSSPALPMMVSLPAPPSIVRPMMPGRQRRGALIVSLPAPALIVSVSMASGWSTLTCSGKPADRDAGGGRHHVDRVGARRAVDGHLIGRAVAAAGADDAEVDPDLLHGGAGQVADRDGVGAAERIELDGLDAVEVHGDVGDVAGERHVTAGSRP